MASGKLAAKSHRPANASTERGRRLTSWSAWPIWQPIFAPNISLISGFT